MRRFVILFIAFAFVAGTTSLAMAQAVAKNATGRVTSASADRVVVAGKDTGKPAKWTFAIDPRTKIQKGGKDIPAADLKPGDTVDIWYSEVDGKARADAITVRAAARAKPRNPCAAGN